MGSLAFGTLLKIAGTTIAELQSISGPSESKATVDVSHHGSANRYRDFLSGMKDGGEISIEGNFTNEAGQALLRANFEGDATAAFTITFPVTPVIIWTFTGIATAFGTTAPHADKISFTASIKITGKPALTVDTSANMTTIAGIEETAAAALVLVPAWVATTYVFVATVNTASTWIKLTLTGAGVLTVNGNVVTTAVQTGQLTLGAAGTLTVFTCVTTEAGKAPVTYTLTISRL